ncbi:MAG: TerB family tellurite resistance protein [Proteobacteria bacterium]|nr:TerB family tellurite resistance protein [Pseudomonadota bacterium]
MDDPVIESMSQEIKEWFALAIVGMICADGRVDKAELAYLKNIIGFLDDKALIGSMLEKVKNGEIPSLKPISIDQETAASIMRHLTMLSIVDQDLDSSEEAFLNHVGEQLRLPPGVPAKFLAHARKQLGGKTYPAKLTMGASPLEIRCFGLSEKGCMLYTNATVNPKARITVQLYQPQDEGKPDEMYHPIRANCTWCRPVKSRFGKFVVKAVFQQTFLESQGAALMTPSKNHSEGSRTGLKPSNSSLLGFYVQCRACGKRNIPFWLLRSKSMVTVDNIFDIPVYMKSVEGKDFCDFNLLQVTVCPKCFFASNQMEFFKRQDGPVKPPPFDVEAFASQWKTTALDRKRILNGDTGWLASEKRTPAQAGQSYRLASITYDHLASLETENGIVNYKRRSALFLMTQAELAMSNGDPDNAENSIRKAEKRLEAIFSKLEKDVSIRSAYQLAMMKIYFRKYEEAGDYLHLLKHYDRTRHVAAGSKEYRALAQANNLTADLWLNRKKYDSNVLADFHSDR